MKPNTNSEAAETVQTTSVPAVVQERLVLSGSDSVLVDRRPMASRIYANRDDIHSIDVTIDPLLRPPVTINLGRSKVLLYQIDVLIAMLHVAKSEAERILSPPDEAE